MQHITQLRLTHLAEEMLRIIRSDESIPEDEVLMVTASREGHMSFRGNDFDALFLQNTNHWMSTTKVGEHKYEYNFNFKKYTCFDCKYCGRANDEGRCMCFKDSQLTIDDAPACENFKEDIHE